MASPHQELPMHPLSLAEWPLLVHPHKHTSWPPCAHEELHDISQPFHFHSSHSWGAWAEYRRGRLGGYAEAAKRGASRRALLEAVGTPGRTALPAELQLQIFAYVFKDWIYQPRVEQYEAMEDTIQRLFAGYSNPAMEEVALTALCETVRHEEVLHQDWIENGLDINLTQNWQPEPSNIRYLEISARLDMVATISNWSMTGTPEDHLTVEQRSRRSLQFVEKFGSLRTLTINLLGGTEVDSARLLTTLSTRRFRDILPTFLDGLMILQKEKRIKVTLRSCVPGQQRGPRLAGLVSANLDGSNTGKEVCGGFVDGVKEMIGHTAAREEHERAQEDRTMSD